MGLVETPNKYSVRDSSGQVQIQFIQYKLTRSCKINFSVQELFTAEERMENSAGEQFHFGLACCEAARSFDVGVLDVQGNEAGISICHFPPFW